MPTLELTEEQGVELIRQLPPERKRAVWQILGAERIYQHSPETGDFGVVYKRGDLCLPLLVETTAQGEAQLVVLSLSR